MTASISQNQAQLAAAKGEVTGAGATISSAVVGASAGVGALAVTGDPIMAVAVGLFGFFAGILGFKAYRATQKMAPSTAAPMPC